LSQFSPRKVPAGFYKQYQIPKDKPLIAFVGRLDREKSVDILIQAFNQLRRRDEKLHLLLVGDGNFRERLVKLVAELGVRDRVIFTGRVTGEDLVNMYRVATLYATASTTEVQSIAILEAMACGKPIVAVDAGPMAEICRHDVNGLLSSEHDLAGFVDNLACILEDAKLRARLARGGLTVAKEYSIGASAGEYRSVYQAATDK